MEVIHGVVNSAAGDCLIKFGGGPGNAVHGQPQIGHIVRRRADHRHRQFPNFLREFIADLIQCAVRLGGHKHPFALRQEMREQRRSHVGFTRARWALNHHLAVLIHAFNNALLNVIQRKRAENVLAKRHHRARLIRRHDRRFLVRVQQRQQARRNSPGLLNLGGNFLVRHGKTRVLALAQNQGGCPVNHRRFLRLRAPATRQIHRRRGQTVGGKHAEIIKQFDIKNMARVLGGLGGYVLDKRTILKSLHRNEIHFGLQRCGTIGQRIPNLPRRLIQRRRHRHRKQMPVNLCALGPLPAGCPRQQPQAQHQFELLAGLAGINVRVKQRVIHVLILLRRSPRIPLFQPVVGLLRGLLVRIRLHRGPTPVVVRRTLNPRLQLLWQPGCLHMLRATRSNDHRIPRAARIIISIQQAQTLPQQRIHPHRPPVGRGIMRHIRQPHHAAPVLEALDISGGVFTQAADLRKELEKPRCFVRLSGHAITPITGSQDAYTSLIFLLHLCSKASPKPKKHPLSAA